MNQYLMELSQQRRYWLALVLFGIALESGALYFQYVLDEWPCVLCIHVRIWVVAFILLGICRVIFYDINLDENALIMGTESGPAIPRNGTLLGHLFESLVTQSVRVLAQAAEANVKHLRLKGGLREVDLIVERPDQRVVAIEVKLSATVDDDDVKNLLWLREQIGDDLLNAVVINTGQHAYKRRMASP